MKVEGNSLAVYPHVAIPVVEYLGLLIAGENPAGQVLGTEIRRNVRDVAIGVILR